MPLKMKSVRTRSEASKLSLPSLVFIYVLLAILGVLFSSAFFADTLSGEREPQNLVLAVFLSIPLVLLGFLVVSIIRLGRDVFSRRSGGKFRARLLAYFTIIAILASIPATLITFRFVGELLRAWNPSEIQTALGDARYFALDSYRYRLAALERGAKSSAGERALALARKGSEEAARSALRSEDEAYLSIQEFSKDASGTWLESGFAGDLSLALEEPPAFKPGFLPKDSSRDKDLMRYISIQRESKLQVSSFSLGQDFDGRVQRLETNFSRASSVANLEKSLGSTLLLLYAAFSLPTLLMAVIIAISLSSLITQPIVELADATRRVAEGDFSIRILTRDRDELAALVSSFNAMVRSLESSQKALLRTEKINIWQDMAQRLAHEVKNPLTPIKLSAERVLRRWKMEPEQLPEILESCMVNIIQEVDALNAMLIEFRSFSRLSSPDQSWTSIRDLVQESIKNYQESQPNIEFNFESIDPTLVVKMDRRHIAQVLANLILNSIAAMDSRGMIEFTTDLVKKRDSRYCRLSIRDNGKGISEADRPYIFTPYYTTKDSGTGLGLAIVERIISDHGGSIWFDSAEGVGTTFFIDLPIDLPGTTENEGAMTT
ncbi:ATP-binding protein [Treponema sp.]